MKGNNKSKNEDRLAYGRIKHVINSRVRKRGKGEYAKYYVLVDDRSLPIAAALIDEVRKGNAKILHVRTAEGRKFKEKFGVNPPTILKKEEDGYMVVRIVKRGDTYEIQL